MVYIHTAFFICPSVSAKNRPGFRYWKPGRFFALLVLSQALTPLLAGVLDGSLGRCQNCRALGVAMIRYLKIFSLPYSISAMIFSKFSSCK